MHQALKKNYIIFNIFFSLSSYRPVVICIALSLPLLSFIPMLKSCAKFPKGSSLSEQACSNVLVCLLKQLLPQINHTKFLTNLQLQKKTEELLKPMKHIKQVTTVSTVIQQLHHLSCNQLIQGVCRIYILLQMRNICNLLFLLAFHNIFQRLK